MFTVLSSKTWTRGKPSYLSTACLSTYYISCCCDGEEWTSPVLVKHCSLCQCGRRLSAKPIQPPSLITCIFDFAFSVTIIVQYWHFGDSGLGRKWLCCLCRMRNAVQHTASRDSSAWQRVLWKLGCCLLAATYCELLLRHFVNQTKSWSQWLKMPGHSYPIKDHFTQARSALRQTSGNHSPSFTLEHHLNGGGVEYFGLI